MDKEHHHTTASDPERDAPEVARSNALEALRDGPTGALIIAAGAVGLLFLGWLFFYFVLFMARGDVG